VRWLLVIAIVAACGGEKKPKSKPVEDAGIAVDAMRVTTEDERDRLFLAVPTAKAVDGIIERLAAKPHVAGTKANEDVAKEIMRTLGRMGWKLGTADYRAYLPLPRDVSIVVEGDDGFELSTVEAANAKHPASPELLAWIAGSASGTAKAPVVYASYGRAEELAALKRAGVDVKGKVVLLRDGPLDRGAQVASVERAGAKAVIFYVDPEDEPDRPRDSVQRGTVAYDWQYPGDALTPGIAAKPDVPRTPAAKAEVLPKIPVVTVTADEAHRLLAKLGGPDASPELAGALPGPYKLGPGPTVTVTVELDVDSRPVRNIIGILDGKSKDAVVLGSHYDAWGPGAIDPHSGTATLLEIARGLTALTRAGWRPKRTIIIAFWDGGERGAIGSTEWVEEQLEMLRANAIAYFDVERVTPGPLVINGSPALREHVRACAHDVTDPSTGAPFEVTFGDLGIGADGTAFLHHAGVASLQWQTGAGKGRYHVWHSLLDDHATAKAQTDPDFAFIPAFAQVMGLCAVRLADADYLPLRYSETAAWLDDALAALATTTKLDRAKLDPALEVLRTAALHAESLPMKAGGDPAKCNAALVVAERGFLAPDGLAGRPWYRHLATGPDPTTGYAALRLPELAAAAAVEDRKALARATQRLVEAIERVAKTLEDGCR